MDTATAPPPPGPPLSLLKMNVFFRHIHPANGRKNQSRRLHTLTELSARPGMFAEQIATRIGMNGVSALRILHELERGGFIIIRKHTEDRGNPRLTAWITPLGQSAVDALTPFFLSTHVGPLTP